MLNNRIKVATLFLVVINSNSRLATVCYTALITTALMAPHKFHHSFFPCAHDRTKKWKIEKKSKCLLRHGLSGRERAKEILGTTAPLRAPRSIYKRLTFLHSLDMKDVQPSLAHAVRPLPRSMTCYRTVKCK